MQYIDEETYELPKSDGGLFMKLQEGENRIRIVSKTLGFLKHQIRNGAKFSSEICDNPDMCQLCAGGDAPKQRFAWVVIDRADGGVKVLEVGYSIFGQALAYKKDEDYGDYRQYDLKITKTGQGLDTEYKVIASPKQAPLTGEEKQNVEEANIDLQRIFSKKSTAQEPVTQTVPEEVDLDDIPF